MPRVLILADDLSGAADCGIACVRAGLNAVVSLGSPSSEMTIDVVALDADTRSMSAVAASQRMSQLVQAHAHDPALLLFKKIDSTLRGHLGPELAAVLEARRAAVPGAVAIMAPAFPANGRTTVEGLHFVHGKALHETDTWKSEKMTGAAHIPQMLQRSGLSCLHLNLASVRSPQASLNRAISEAAGAADVIVCDATTDDDLRAIAEAAVSLQGCAVWVGSAGLAHQLPKATGLALSEADVIQHLPDTAGSILFVIGSASPTTRQQVATLLSSSDIPGIVVPPKVLLDGPESPQWKAFATELCVAVDRGEDIALACGPEPVFDPIDRPRLSQALGEMAATLRGKVGALVASGGETARNVLDRWGVVTMQLHGELETGVPISSTVVDQNRPLTIITKAGDFGQPNTLLHCHQWLSKKRTL
jgi:D-threonate/D-erythronate kinase